MPRSVELNAAGAVAALAAWLLASSVLAASHDHATPVVLAPGYAELTFEPPAPGSYRLPPLGAAVDGAVLDSEGQARQLHDLMGDGLVVLSFIFTRCSDVNGCPLATHVFGRVAEVLGEAPELAGQVRLISLSFDPAYDTPEVMKAYGRRYQRPGVSWQFLTTSGADVLDPLLEAYGQWVIPDLDAQGNPVGSMSHVLRVYLIDQAKQIRNIYSVSFLHADTIANDIRTLLMR